MDIWNAVGLAAFTFLCGFKAGSWLAIYDINRFIESIKGKK